LRADPGQRADVAGLQLVLAHDGFRGFVDFLLGKGNLHAQDLGAVEEALGVLFEPEDRRAALGVVGPHAFKGAAAVMQGVAQHMDLGVAPVDHLAVHPDFAVAVCHGGCYWGHDGILL
jgi:hypothetical protein